MTESLTAKKLCNFVNEPKGKLRLKFIWTNRDRIYLKHGKNSKNSKTCHARQRILKTSRRNRIGSRG